MIVVVVVVVVHLQVVEDQTPGLFGREEEREMSRYYYVGGFTVPDFGPFYR